MPTYKQQAKDFCKHYLKNLELLHYYSDKLFESYYRKAKCAYGNIVAIGMDAADYILKYAEPQPIDQEPEED